MLKNRLGCVLTQKPGAKTKVKQLEVINHVKTLSVVIPIPKKILARIFTFSDFFLVGEWICVS